MTKGETILVAMRSLESRLGGSAMDHDLIVIETWQHDRHSFGLRGYAQIYPDSKRVAMELPKLKAKKLIVSAGTRMYRLTDLGRATAAAMPPVVAVA